MMNDKRRPPAYLEYASDLRSTPTYMFLTNDERAVLHGLKLALWCSDEVPLDPPILARILLMSERDLVRGLTERVLDQFARVPGRPDHIHSPELDAQMDRLRNVRAKQAEGGRVGAEKTNLIRFKQKQGAGDPTS